MKIKKLLACAVTGVILTSLTACSLISQFPDQNAGASTPSADALLPAVEGQTSIATGKLKLTAADLPEQYRITYEVDNGDGTITVITQARDADGNVYVRDGGAEHWFISSGTGYVEATPNRDGALEPVGSGTLLTELYVEQTAASFWNCAGELSALIAPGYEDSGTETIAGRLCTVYSYTMGTDKMNVTYSVYMDQETGICLGKTEEAALGIFTPKPSMGTFLCTDFSVEDIELPANGG